jgi:HAD superfamily hydrolase (TIGR01509 family)
MEESIMDAACRIRAVAFDLDGLMFNTEELYTQVGTVMLQRRGKQITRELLSAMMGRQSPVALQIMIDWHNLSDTVEQLENETDEIFDGILEQQLAPLPGLLSLLDALNAARIPKAITTSSRRKFVDRCLQISGLDGQFQFVLSAEDVVNGKPDPEIYRKAAERFGIPPTEMMVLEDSENGCRAAVGAGAITIAVPGEHSRDHDFSGVFYQATNLADKQIVGLLGSNGSVG